jgi:hypothetical protein
MREILSGFLQTNMLLEQRFLSQSEKRQGMREESDMRIGNKDRSRGWKRWKGAAAIRGRQRRQNSDEYEDERLLQRV